MSPFFHVFCCPHLFLGHQVALDLASRALTATWGNHRVVRDTDANQMNMGMTQNWDWELYSISYTEYMNMYTYCIWVNNGYTCSKCIIYIRIYTL